MYIPCGRIENLVPLTDDARRKGAYAANAARRRKRELRDLLAQLVTLPLTPGELSDIDSVSGALDSNVTAQEAIALAQIAKAVKGDTQAAIFIRDTLGEKPRDGIDLTGFAPVVFIDDLPDEEPLEASIIGDDNDPGDTAV